MREALWFLVTIGILIPIHEYGHYRVARACGVKVLRFSIGIGRVVWKRRFGVDGTEFAISAIPLGGYVRMVDRRDPTQAIPPEDMAREFTSRPLRHRVAILAAGPAANLLLAVLLFAFVAWYGVDEAAPVASTPVAGSLAAEAGLRSGDRIVATLEGGSTVANEDDWRDVRAFGDVSDAVTEAMVDRQAVQLRVTHPGEAGVRTLKLAVDTLDLDQPGVGTARRLGIGGPYAMARIGDVVPSGAAARAGGNAGDLVVRVDGQPVADTQALREAIIATARAGAPRAMQWEVRRGDAILALAVTPRVVAEGTERVARVGVTFDPPEKVVLRDDPLTALRQGAVQTWRTSVATLRMFGRMLVGQASLKNLSGPFTIADVASRSADLGLAAFVGFLALVSVNLGVLNLLPVPILDGGTLLYYLLEGATGRPVSDLWQARLQYGGVLAIVLLMSIALSNDVARMLGLQ